MSNTGTILSKLLFPIKFISDTNSTPQFISGLSVPKSAYMDHDFWKGKRKGKDATAGLPDPDNIHGRSMYPCAVSPSVIVKTRSPWFDSLQV